MSIGSYDRHAISASGYRARSSHVDGRNFRCLSIMRQSNVFNMLGIPRSVTIEQNIMTRSRIIKPENARIQEVLRLWLGQQLLHPLLASFHGPLSILS